MSSKVQCSVVRWDVKLISSSIWTDMVDNLDKTSKRLVHEFIYRSWFLLLLLFLVVRSLRPVFHRIKSEHLSFILCKEVKRSSVKTFLFIYWLHVKLLYFDVP